MSENTTEKEQIEVTLVEIEGEEYHLETLVHEVLDRTYLLGMMLEESIVNHPYFKIACRGKAEEVLTAVWDLYQYLGTAEADLVDTNKDSKLCTPTGDKT